MSRAVCHWLERMCTDKHRFTTEEEAQHEIDRHHAQARLEVYRHDKHFHIGHKRGAREVRR